MSKLAKACELSFNDWLATFPDVIPEAECSKKHEKWKKRLFDKMRGDRYHTFTTKTIKVILVAAILSVLLLSAFVFPSSRQSLLDSFDKFSLYKITENNKNSVSYDINVGYIPDGFEFSERIDMDKQILYKYHNNNGDFFTIIKSSSSTNVNFNTENNISEEFFIDEIKYTYCVGNYGVNNLLWTKNDYVFRIDGNISFDKLIMIAKTVE